MVDEPGLTPEERALLRQYVSIDGDENVVGNDNDVQVIKQTAGEYAVQIGEQRITFSIEELHQALYFISITYQGVQFDIPSCEAVIEHRCALLEDLQIQSNRWGGMTSYIPEEGATLPIEASPYEKGRVGSREKLIQALHEADRLIVLGGAGSGKTVSLQRLAWELCQGSDLSIPVLIKLFRYDGQPLAKWVRAELQEMGHLRLDSTQALAAFLKESESRCVFLFDGLNEVQPAYRDDLVGELTRWMKNYPHHPVILTSRSQDEVWRRLRDEMDRALVLQPIEDEQARQYLMACLPEDRRGAELYNQLDDRLREMACTPLILWLIKEAGGAEESIPGNRGELYRRFVSRMLRRDTKRRMDAEISERLKRRALTEIAYYLSQDKRLVCSREEAIHVIGARRDGDERLAENVIRSCARHGLLAGEDEIWFVPHQTVQEHFAALALKEIATREWTLASWQRLKRGVKRLLTGQWEGLRALAADDWWMETFVQLAGLVRDADRLVQEVMPVNPWLAWWCVEEGQDVAEKTRDAVRDRSVRLLGSDRVIDRRRAVTALARIRSDRTVDPLFRAAGDADEEVAGLAVEALVERERDDVRKQALNVAQQSNHPLHQSGLAYLKGYFKGVLGISMVWVPPGPFLMGSDKGQDPQARDKELPQHEVTISGYWIGRYPVTVAQFRVFVEDSGYEVDEDSLTDPDNHPVRWVSWDDARAYCHWLSDKRGLAVRLPNEAEWEKAARGTDGRIYPWGNELPTDDFYSFEFNAGVMTPVGKDSPQGDSPYGCADMAGNVREWTRSLVEDYPYDPADGREDPDAEGRRVLRGGAFYTDQLLVRCAYRHWILPSYRHYTFGFRVVVSPSPSGA